VGRPKTSPDVMVKDGKVYVSWNGATEVTWWRLEMAKALNATDDEFVTIQGLERNGFDTSFALNEIDEFVRIAALDAVRGVMAYSATVRATSRSFESPNTTF
jgi:hypothetical protein